MAREGEPPVVEAKAEGAMAAAELEAARMAMEEATMAKAARMGAESVAMVAAGG